MTEIEIPKTPTALRAFLKGNNENKQAPYQRLVDALLDGRISVVEYSSRASLLESELKIDDREENA